LLAASARFCLISSNFFENLQVAKSYGKSKPGTQSQSRNLIEVGKQESGHLINHI